MCSGIAVSGVAGCLSRDVTDRGGSPTETRTSTGTDTDTTTSEDRVNVSDLSMEAELNEQTEAKPPVIRLVLHNGSNASVTLSGGATPPFSRYWPANGGDLLIIPEDTEYLSPSMESDEWVTRDDNGCWKATQRLTVASIGTETRLLEGGSVEQRYRVVTRNSAASCANADSYVYSQDIRVDEEEERAEVEIELSDGRVSAVEARL